MADDTENEGQGRGILQWMIALLVVTGLSAGAGTLASFQMLSTVDRLVDSKRDVVEQPVIEPIARAVAEIRARSLVFICGSF